MQENSSFILVIYLLMSLFASIYNQFGHLSNVSIQRISLCRFAPISSVFSKQNQALNRRPIDSKLPQSTTNLKLASKSSKILCHCMYGFNHAENNERKKEFLRRVKVVHICIETCDISFAMQIPFSQRRDASPCAFLLALHTVYALFPTFHFIGANRTD